jgi:hypothetical protein
MKILLDSNVALDAVLKREQFMPVVSPEELLSLLI